MTTNIPQLIDDLNSESLETQDNAIRSLAYLGEAVMPKLMEAVENDTAPLELLGKTMKLIGGASVDPLGDLLQRDDNELQRKAAYLLAVTGDSRALVQLIITLDDDGEEVRAQVAAALGNFTDVRALGPLLKALRDPSPKVRAQAAIAIGNYDDPRITNALLYALEDAQPEVRRGALQSLAKRADEDDVQTALESLAHDPIESVRQMAAAALQYHKGDKVAFERLDLDKDLSDEVGDAIQDMMSDGKLDADDMMVMRHSNPRVRAGLLQFIAEQSGSKMVPLILPGLNDINPAVRTAAATSLAKMGDKAIPGLLEAVDHSSKFIRAGIADVFGSIGNPRVVEVLIKMLDDSEAQVRLSAAQALAKLRDEQAIEPLGNLLKDDDKKVREQAIAALRALGQDPDQIMGNPISKFFKRFLGGG